MQALAARCPRLHLEWFPGYAPELNPDEWVWAHFKTQLANGHPETLDDLMATLGPDHQARDQAAGSHPLVHHGL